MRIVALQDQERRLLAEIEQGLTADDPRFRTTVKNLNSQLGKTAAVRPD